MLRLYLSLLMLLFSLLPLRAEDGDDFSCKPAYCSASFTVLLGTTDNITRSGSFTDGDFGTAQIELRADVVPLAKDTWANLSVIAILTDRLDVMGNNLGLVIPQIDLFHKHWGLKWRIGYAPVFVFRNLFADNTSHVHSINLGVKKTWENPPFMLDNLDLRFEFKERFGKPKSSGEHRFTLELEAVENFNLFDRKFRIWTELRAETGIKNVDRTGTRVANKFTNTLELTTNLTDHLRLTVFKLRREDQVTGPRTSDYGRWDVSAGFRLKFNW